jgi:hypothetical protein
MPALRLCTGTHTHDIIPGDSGAMHDTIINNIIYGGTSPDKPLIIWPYVHDTTKNHFTLSDYNCYYSAGAYAIHEYYAKAYSLSSWKLKYPDRDINRFRIKSGEGIVGDGFTVEPQWKQLYGSLGNI